MVGNTSCNNENGMENDLHCIKTPMWLTILVTKVETPICEQISVWGQWRPGGG
jgi:hypothetical protein